jgi:hypothetical protein
MKLKTKDVRPKKSVARKSEVKNSADYLPEILAMARYQGSLQQQWVRCGKANCKCTRGQLHGPYFYLFVSTSGGLSKSYVRRADVPTVRVIRSERQHRHSLFQSQMRQTRDFLKQMMEATIGGK